MFMWHLSWRGMLLNGSSIPSGKVSLLLLEMQITHILPILRDDGPRQRHKCPGPIGVHSFHILFQRPCSSFGLHSPQTHTSWIHQIKFSPKHLQMPFMYLSMASDSAPSFTVDVINGSTSNVHISLPIDLTTTNNGLLAVCPRQTPTPVHSPNQQNHKNEKKIKNPTIQ